MFNELQANMRPHLSPLTISALHTCNTDPSEPKQTNNREITIRDGNECRHIHLAVFSVKNVRFQFIHTIIHRPVN